MWKSLNSLGLPSKNKSGSKICLNENGKLNFEPKVNANIFKNFFSNLADDLLKKLPNPKNKFNMDSVKSHYVKLGLKEKSFSFSRIDEIDTTQIFLLKLCQPYGKTLKGQKGLSYLAPPPPPPCGIKLTQNVN